MLAPQAAISNWALHVSITKPLVQASIAILALLASIADFPSEPSSLNWPSRPQLLWWPALSQSLQFTIPQQSFPGFNCYTGPFCLNYFVNQVGRNGNADSKVPWPFQPQLPQMALQASIALLTIKVSTTTKALQASLAHLALKTSIAMLVIKMSIIDLNLKALIVVLASKPLSPRWPSKSPHMLSLVLSLLLAPVFSLEHSSANKLSSAMLAINFHMLYPMFSRAPSGALPLLSHAMFASTQSILYTDSHKENISWDCNISFQCSLQAARILNTDPFCSWSIALVIKYKAALISIASLHFQNSLWSPLASLHL